MSGEQELDPITDTKYRVVLTIRSCLSQRPTIIVQGREKAAQLMCVCAFRDMQELDQEGQEQGVLSGEEQWGSRSHWGGNLHSQR